MTLPVTCVITSFNNAQTLRKAVDSVLAQTAPPAEIVIADDASSDGSRDLIAALAASDARVTPILRDQNLGVSRNRDLAIRAARQPVVTHLDGDDIFLRQKIATEWRALADNPNRIAFSDIVIVHPHRPWRNSVLSTGAMQGQGTAVLENLLSRRHPIPRDMLLPKTLFEKAGGFAEGINLYEDWDLKLRLALCGAEWVHGGGLGTLYVQRGGSLSRDDPARLIEAQARVVLARMEPLEQALGRPRLAAILSEVFGTQIDEASIAERELPSGLPGRPRPARWRAIGNRIRALRALPLIWPARNG